MQGLGRAMSCLTLPIPLDAPFLNSGGHLPLPFFPGFVGIPGLMAVVFPYAVYQVPPLSLPAFEYATIRNVSTFVLHGPYQRTRMHSGRCTCLRTLALPCHIAMLGFVTHLHSAFGGTVMPAAL